MKTYFVEAPLVTKQQAFKLMCHHLQLAAMYFEVTTDNYAKGKKELEHLMKNTNMARLPALAWYGSIFNIFAAER